MKMETERLLLRRIEAGDLYDVFEYATDEDTGPRAGWQPHKTIDDTKQIFDIWLDPGNTEKIYAVVFKPDGKVVGTIGIVHLNEKIKDENNAFAKEFIADGKSVFEIGITLSKKYWNKGIATEAVAMMIDYLFREWRADIVMALHYEANVASKKMQEKNGLKVIGTYQREKCWYNTDCKTMIVRAITKDEWLDKK